MGGEKNNLVGKHSLVRDPRAARISEYFDASEPGHNDTSNYSPLPLGLANLWHLLRPNNGAQWPGSFENSNVGGLLTIT